MNRKILFFEQTNTFQSIFEQELKDKPLDLFFEKDAVSFFKTIPEVKPDLILINAANASPSGFAFMRILYETKELQNIPVRMYAGKHYAFDEYYEGITHVQKIIYINKKNISSAIQELVSFDDNYEAPEIKSLSFDEGKMNINIFSTQFGKKSEGKNYFDS